MVPAQGTCMVSRASVNGDSPERTVFQGATDDDQEYGQHVEGQNAQDDGAAHAGNRAPGLRRFRGGDGGDLGAGHGEEHRRHGREHRDPAVRREAAVGREVAESGAMRGGPAEGIRGGDDDEDDDRGHLDRGKPELELGIGAGGHQIDGGHDGHEPESDLERRQLRQPVPEYFRTRDGFDGYDQHPEVPVQPADHETRPLAEAGARELGKRAHVRERRRHLSQHAHHQQNQQPANGVADEARRTAAQDGCAAADEQSRADDAADGDHGQMPTLEGSTQLVLPGRRRCRLCHRVPFQFAAASAAVRVRTASACASPAGALPRA